MLEKFCKLRSTICVDGAGASARHFAIELIQILKLLHHVATKSNQHASAETELISEFSKLID